VEDRRRSKRKTVSIPAAIQSEDAGYECIVENISEHGLCLETDSQELLGTSTRFNPGSEYQVTFQTQNNESIKLHCKVMWSYKAAPHGLKRKVGMEIIFPPPNFVDFYRNLTI
jgi:hypothetical protein